MSSQRIRFNFSPDVFFSPGWYPSWNLTYLLLVTYSHKDLIKLVLIVLLVSLGWETYAGFFSYSRTHESKCLNFLRRYGHVATLLLRMSMKVGDPPFIFEFHITILKVICCRSKKTFLGLEITWPYLLKVGALHTSLERIWVV